MLYSNIQFTGIYKVRFENFNNRFLIYGYTDYQLNGYRLDIDFNERKIRATKLIEGIAQLDGAFEILS